MAELTQQQRKDQLTEMTGGLRCRCPGFGELVQVNCRGINGIRYCKFTCQDPSSGEFSEYPVGHGGLCQCKLGTRINPISTRSVMFEGTEWGYAECDTSLEGQGTKPVDQGKKQDIPVWLPWAAAAGIATFLWFTMKE